MEKRTHITTTLKRYGSWITVPISRCLYFVANGLSYLEEGVTKDEYGMTIVDLNNLGYRDEAFVLAQDVAQVFYIKDMSSKPKKGINKQKRMTLSDT